MLIFIPECFCVWEASPSFPKLSQFLSDLLCWLFSACSLGFYGCPCGVVGVLSVIWCRVLGKVSRSI